jgi:hypothetical protein
MIQAATFLLVLGGLLWLVSIVSTANKLFAPKAWLIHWFYTRKERRLVREYIPHMTPRDKLIIGYLLHHNQKMFTGAADGGSAVTLISRKIVVRAVQGSQIVSGEDMPYAIPDEVWNVLAAHKDQFPYEPPRGETEVHPWRVHWMLRR